MGSRIAHDIPGPSRPVEPERMHPHKLAIILPGCAALVEADWQEAPLHPPLQPYHLVVSDAVLEKACGAPRTGYVFGCAVRIPSEHVCLVSTKPQPAAWVVVHEYTDCNGWDHGPVRKQ